MIKQIASGILIFGGLFIIAFLSMCCYRAKVVVAHTEKARFFLPNDLFIHLTLLINYWVMLVLMLEANILTKESHLMIIVALFAPFLNWWHKKRMGES